MELSSGKEDIMKNALTLYKTNDSLLFWIDSHGKKIDARKDGLPPGLWGCISGLWGRISPELTGCISPGLTGRISPELTGCISGLLGRISPELTGCIDDCELTEDDRAKGIDISTLVA